MSTSSKLRVQLEFGLKILIMFIFLTRRKRKGKNMYIRTKITDFHYVPKSFNKILI